MIATETPTCIKIATHIFAAETFTCLNAAETSNCIIATAIYKPNNITTKLSLKFKPYFFRVSQTKSDRYSPLDPHGA